MQPNLQADLERACDSLYVTVTGGVLTAADKPMLRGEIEHRLGYWTLDRIDVDMDDKAETVRFRVKSGVSTGDITLKWADENGRVWLRVDTDGDGQ